MEMPHFIACDQFPDLTGTLTLYDYTLFAAKNKALKEV